MITSNNHIGILLHQIEPKYMLQLQNYIEFLIFLQQKERSESLPGATANVISTAPKREGSARLQAIRAFKGDAPFPQTEVSKYDVYEQ